MKFKSQADLDNQAFARVNRNLRALRSWLMNNGLPSVMSGVRLQDIPARLLQSPDSLTPSQRQYLQEAKRLVGGSK